MNKLIINPVDYGLEEKKASELTKSLEIVKKERENLIKEFNEVSTLEITQENTKKFRELRLRIQKNRTKGINPWHKKSKEYFLAGSKFVDAIKNMETEINQQMETKLMEGEKHFENLEKERIKQLQIDRIELIKPYVSDTTGLDLGNMPEDVFKPYFESKKKEFEERKRKEEEERKRKEEEERLRKIEEEKKEKERKEKEEKLRIENEKLRIENEKRKKEAELAKKKQEAEEKARKLKEEQEKKKREDEEKARIKKEQELKRKEEEKRKAEEEKRKAAEEKAKKLELELKNEKEAKIKAKKEADEKAKREEEQRIQDELNKSDLEKYQDLINDLKLLKQKYSFKSNKNIKMFNGVKILIDKVITYIEKK